MGLSGKEKFSYGLGAVGKDMVYMLSASYILYYYQDILGVNAVAMGIILLVARVFDAFNDPFMGVIVAKTRTRWGKFRPWLMRILTNTCNDMLRKRSKHRFVPLEDETVAVEPPKTPIPLREAIDTLKPDMRVVVVLYYLEGYSVEETAEVLDIPTGTVKSRMKHARDRLSVLLREEWEGQE